MNILAGASAIALVLLAADTRGREGGHARASAPLAAITTILDAFRTHPVVGLEEEHAELFLSSVISTGGKTFGESKDIYRLENGELIVETTRKTPTGTFTARGVNRKG